MRVYIAGPIAGIQDGNRAAFADRAEMLRAVGHVPVNPWDISPDHTEPGPCLGRPLDNPEEQHRYGCCLREDIKVLMYCDAFTTLPGWARSVGAQTEVHVARSIGLREI